MLKDGVLDPQGKAIEHALHVLGFLDVENVRAGRIIELETAAKTQEAALKQGEEMGRNLLANGVIENFSVEVIQ
ncbi:Phosphoribosylformylglycinamidine synthase subunit PurS [Entomobacter blattae]|uniref:Phosphoribosylformylglycinamidine synthase subunit PurS n=2 Tax=Entomobacter blattae TaxID=2762277 RepID=A0A7H1NSH2_9PROT|nr:Phosphoribosylformylglycinamidine synthase subunit PurS [Entomobacter blattae]